MERITIILCPLQIFVKTLKTLSLPVIIYREMEKNSQTYLFTTL